MQYNHPITSEAEYNNLAENTTESSHLINVAEHSRNSARPLRLSDITKDTLLPEGDAELQEYVDLYRREERKATNLWRATLAVSFFLIPIAIVTVPYACRKEDQLFLLETKLEETGKYKIESSGNSISRRNHIVSAETP